MCTQISSPKSHLNLIHELRHTALSAAGCATTACSDSAPACQGDGGTQLSLQARQLMTVVSMMNAVVNGRFGQLMGLLGSPLSFNGSANFAHAVPAGAVPARRGFGESVCRGCAGAERAQSNAPQVGAGQSKELKAGEEVRGANGTVLRWGKDGNVDISYKDRNGQEKTINVKDGMLTMDGGRPQKLENVGQMLKLPNGDVVGIGNNPSDSGGKVLCRVVMADQADKIACEPAHATNVYDIQELEQRQTHMQGGGISMNFNSISFATPNGMMNLSSFSINEFLGHPVTRVFTEQQMKLTGTR